MSEDKADEILQRARSTRRGSSRALWIVAGVIGGICTIAFLVLLFSDRGTATVPERVTDDHGLGFGAGILVGAVVGIVIGYYVCRQSARNTP